jgi:hypothetical protein
MARWNVGLCGSEPAILNSAAKRFQNEVFFHENSRLPRGFFAFADLGFDPCPSLRPWPPGVQQGKTVTIRGKLNGTNTGTSAPLTPPFSGVFGAAPVGETGEWREQSWWLADVGIPECLRGRCDQSGECARDGSVAQRPVLTGRRASVFSAFGMRVRREFCLTLRSMTDGQHQPVLLAWCR